MGDHLLPTMNWGSDNLPEAFRLFKQKMELYFVIKGIKAENQVPYILRGVDDEGLRRFNSWVLTELQMKDAAHIWKRFEDQLTPPENFRVARLKLHYFYQKQGETLDEFVTRCRQQALKCDFDPDQLTERILEQIIASTPIVDFQKGLLETARGFTLDEALRLGRTFEATQQSLSDLKSMSSTSSGPTQSIVKTDNVIRKSVCKNCGTSHPRNKCKAYHDICDGCGKKGHWKKFCLTLKNFRRQGSYNKHQNTFKRTRPRTPSRESKHRGHRTTEQERKSFHEIGERFDNITFEAITVSSVNTSDRDSTQSEAFVSVNIDLERPGSMKYNLKLKVDTGAQGNTLPLRIFRQMFPERLNPDGYPRDITPEHSTRLIAYNSTDIKCFGSVVIRSQYNKSQWFDLKFYVVDVGGPAVLGLSSGQKLGVVTLHCEMTQTESQNKPLKPINSVQDLIKAFPNQFDRIGQFAGATRLNLVENAEPYSDPPRKYPIHLKDKLKAELDSMEENGVIQKVEQHTDWCSSLAFATKADGSLRVCLDPAKLNKALKRCPHKIPTLEELNHRFSHAQYFSKLDAKAGYWSIKLDEESQLLTTFRTPFGRYCFKRLPFGLSVSQDIFQQHMDTILERCDGAVGITDDVVVYGSTQEEHDRNLMQLMQVAEQHGLVFNSKKCFIKKQQVSFFGMIYGIEGIRPDPKKVEDIKNMKPPDSKKELLEFLGMVQYLSPFIENLAAQASPLRSLLKQDVPFVWDTDHQQCFEQLKTHVSSDATLQYFDVNMPTVLQVDASQKGLGAALMQRDVKGQERPIAYASKTLSDTEARYANIERELLAVCFGVERFRTYVFGKKFHIITDHKPLIMILDKNLTAAPPRLQRMMLKLQGYDFTIEYRPGKELSLPDSLSRFPNPDNKDAIDLDIRVDHVQFTANKLSEIQREVRSDPVLNQLSETIIQGWPDVMKDLPTDIRTYWSYRDELSVVNGIIMKGERVLIPDSMKSQILTQLHVGHLGADKTKLRAKITVFWHKINNDIEDMCRKCSVCSEMRSSQSHQPLQQHDVPTKPWDMVGTDLFLLDRENYVIIADYYSKYVIVRKLPDPCPSSVLVSITKQVFAELGIPRKVMSDNGPHYSSHVYKQFAAEWGFQHVTSSPHYPRSNGFVERQIRTVKNTIIKARKAKDDVEMSLLTLRTTPIDHRLQSPGELLFGRKLRDNLPVFIENKLSHRDEIAERLLQRQQSQKSYHDRSTRELAPLYPNQSVMVQDPVSKRWAPATVQSKCAEPRSYIVQSQHGGLVRRNRHQLREAANSRKSVSFANPLVNTEDTHTRVSHQSRSVNITHTPSKPLQESQPATQSQPINQTVDEPYITRSGRVVKTNRKFSESM